MVDPVRQYLVVVTDAFVEVASRAISASSSQYCIAKSLVRETVTIALQAQPTRLFVTPILVEMVPPVKHCPVERFNVLVL